MTRAMKVLLAASVATCGGCARTVPLAPPSCFHPQMDTVWFVLANQPRTIAATMKVCP